MDEETQNRLTIKTFSKRMTERVQLTVAIRN